MKKLLAFLFIVFVYLVLFMVSIAVLPFSLAFKDMNTDGNPLSMLYLFISSLFICFSIYYLASNTSWRGIRRVIGIVFVVFFVASFMTQIETLFFGEAFPTLTKADVLFIAFAPIPSIIAATLLSVTFFGEKEFALNKDIDIKITTFIPKILLIGLIYTVIYFLFGYFVAWQFEELRIFYSGTVENAGFIGQLMNNFHDNAIIYPFQFIRGVLFALGVLPLLYMLQRKKLVFITGVSLVYLCTAVVLIIPNPLFPDIVRWAHFIEMFFSMLLFGVITGHILYVPEPDSYS